MSVRLAIIILNYRTPKLTLDCLESLKGQTGEDTEVVVVDNCSGDGSADQIEGEIVRRGFGWARLLRSPVNGGFAAGNNMGIRATDAEAYILLNSDTVVRPGALEALRDAMERHPEAGLIGPRFENAAGKADMSTFRTVRPLSELVRSANTGPISRALRSYDVALEAGKEALEPGWVGFACVLVRREVIERVGLLDDGYFMYFEDMDYCRRAREAGYAVLYWPEATVVHLQGGSSHVTSVEGEHRRAPRYYYEARARYFAKFHGYGGLWAANALFCAGYCISRARAYLEKREPPHRRREAIDVWTNAVRPFRPSSASAAHTELGLAQDA